MSVMECFSPSLTAHHVTGSAPDILQQISDRKCNLAIWKRPAVLDEKPLFAGNPQDARVTVPALEPEEQLQGELDQCGFVESASRRLLIEDISNLCRLFHQLGHYPHVDVRVERVTGNACWKFHSDYVDMRLITTYAGRGTQWIDQDDVRRMADGLEPLNVHEMEPGDVGLFKGRIGTSQPIIHRSPPIDGTGEQRLLVVLNPAED